MHLRTVKKSWVVIALATAGLVACWAILLATAQADDASVSKPAKSDPKSEPADDMEYWLNQARTATGPSDAAAPAATTPDASNPPRADAVPGVVELSNAKRLPGWLYTTSEKPYAVFVESEQRWRQVPLIVVLSITAVVAEEKMEQEWRWKEMGVPERVYTGKEYPTRRLEWKFHLIDGTTITGAVKGQPLWVEFAGAKAGPMVLSERSKGDMGKSLADLVYIKQIIISRKMMDAVMKDPPATQPAK